MNISVFINHKILQTQVEGATRCENQMSGDRAVVECRDYCEESGCNKALRTRGGLALTLASLYFVLQHWDRGI